MTDAATCRFQQTQEKGRIMNAHQEWVEFLSAKEAAPIELMPERSALLIVDMQRYFVEPGNSFTDVLEKLVPNVYAGYLDRVHNHVIPKIQQLLTAFREAGAPVIYITVGTESGDGTDLPCWLGSLDTLGMETIGEPVCSPVDVPRWQITDAIAPQKDEIILNKRFCRNICDHQSPAGTAKAQYRTRCLMWRCD